MAREVIEQYQADGYEIEKIYTVFRRDDVWWNKEQHARD